MRDAAGCGGAGAPPLAAALDRLQAAAAVAVGTETVPLDAACGRYLATPVTPRDDVPGADRAAVDGWAFAWSDRIGLEGAVLARLEGTATAGSPLPVRVPAGGAARVLTGAVPPEGTDTIAPDELCRLDGPGHVAVPAGLLRHANRRRAAEDLRAGEPVLGTGARIDARHLAVLAACGRAAVTVHARLEVGLVSTGDELVPVEATPGPAATRDVNRPMLRGLLEGIGATVIDLGLIDDRPERVEALLERAASAVPVIVVSGGAAGSEADHAARRIDAAGTWLVRRVAVRPGAPFSVARLGDTTVILLPGNPAAAFLTFLRLARPLLVAMAGGRWPVPRTWPVQAGFDLDKKPGRTEYLRAGLADRALSSPVAIPVARQGSAIVSSLVEAQGFLELEHDRAAVRTGETLRFLPFSELLG